MGDGEVARKPAYAVALRRLARRPLTEAEVRSLLEQGEYPAEEIDAALERLRSARYLNDGELARTYLAARSRRKGHGPRRLIDELERRGVAPGVARAAWDAVSEEEGIEAADLLREQVRKRLAPLGGRLPPDAYPRVYNALLRAGFDGAAIYEALRPHCSFADADGPDVARGTPNDFS